MADFDTCFDWFEHFEDPENLHATVPDRPPGAHAISGINSAAWPVQFAAINAIPQSQRGPAVRAFYLAYFWNRWFGAISSNEVINRVLDMGVNGGEGTAIKLLQQAIPEAGGPAVDVDGALGPNTVAAANGCNEGELVTAYKAARCQHYRDLVDRNPELEPDLREWLARAEA